MLRQASHPKIPPDAAMPVSQPCDHAPVCLEVATQDAPATIKSTDKDGKIRERQTRPIDCSTQGRVDGRGDFDISHPDRNDRPLGRRNSRPDAGGVAGVAGADREPTAPGRIVGAHATAAAVDTRPSGWIEPGEQLYSKSGRALSLVPAFHPGGGGQKRRADKLRKWLLLEARQEQLPPSVNVWLRDAVADMLPNNLSTSDVDLLREVLFGESLGPTTANRAALARVTPEGQPCKS